MKRERNKEREREGGRERRERGRIKLYTLSHTMYRPPFALWTLTVVRLSFLTNFPAFPTRTGCWFRSQRSCTNTTSAALIWLTSPTLPTAPT